MLSFHNEKSIKEKYLNRVKLHRELDNIIQGTGWENGKGCAVGCTLENYDHSRYPIELGIPEWLARLEDRIFEGLIKEKAILWPETFLVAIPVGVDLEKVKHQLAIKRMDNLLEIQTKLLEKNHNLEEIFVNTINAINLVKHCHELESNNVHCNWSAALSAAESAAESAAGLAALSARSAAGSAALSAALSAAESAALSALSEEWSALSAWSSLSAAESAALSAEWSARSAAESAAWEKEADNLIEILQKL